MRVNSINTGLLGHGNFYHQNKIGVTGNSNPKIAQNSGCCDSVSFKASASIGGGVGTLLGGAAGLGLALLAAAGGAGVLVATMIGGAIGGINGDIIQSNNVNNNDNDDDDTAKFGYSDYNDFIYEAHRV